MQLRRSAAKPEPNPHSPWLSGGSREDEIEAIIGGNAIDFYGLDAAKLAPIAARIGPEKGTFKETSA